MAKQRRSSENGFTLVETAIAMVVFGILMLIFAGSLPVARKAAEQNGQYAQALSLCQHKIDQCRAKGYGKLTMTELKSNWIIDETSTTTLYTFTTVDNVGDTPDSPTASTLFPPSTGPMTKLDIKFNAPDVPNTSTAKVIVTVNWSRTKGGPKTCSTSMTAYIANAE